MTDMVVFSGQMGVELFCAYCMQCERQLREAFDAIDFGTLSIVTRLAHNHHGFGCCEAFVLLI